MKLYKQVIIYSFAFAILQGCILSKTYDKQNNLNYYVPNDDWTMLLTTLNLKTCKYIIFDKIDEFNNGAFDPPNSKLTFNLKKETINLQFNSTYLSINVDNKKTIANIKIPFAKRRPKHIINNIYKVISENDTLIVIEYQIIGGSSKALNWVEYIAIDKSFNYYLLSAYRGRLVCFSDLDKDGDIDFLEISNPLALPTFEETYTEVYSFNFLEFKDGKIIKKNYKYSKLAVINCGGDYNYNYIPIHKDSVLMLDVNPCLEENISIRNEIEKRPSPIID